jgi:hypothetical protein
MVRVALQSLIALCVLLVLLLLVDTGPPIEAQCNAGGRFTFAGATHVDMQVAPLAGFIAACYTTAGAQIAGTTITVPNSTLVMADFGSAQTGYCVVK